MIGDNCSGCGSANTVIVIESDSGDYCLCGECNRKYKKTGKIPVDYLVTKITGLIRIIEAEN